MNSQRARDINELKKQAIQFYTENSDITKRVEDALNNLFYDSPYDVYGYLSEFFAKFSKLPFFTKVVAQKSTFYDSKCQPTLKLDFYCQVRNFEKKFFSIEALCFSHEPINESAKIQNIQEDDEYRLSKLNEILNFINSEISDLTRNFSPYDQEELDEKLRSLFTNKHRQIYQQFIASLSLKAQSNASHFESIEGKKSKTPTSPKQKAKNRKPSQAPGSNSTIFGDDLNILMHSSFFASFIEPLISKSICICSSNISNKQPFEIISELKKIKIDKYSMPIPMITLIQNGKGYNGKQNLIKEFIILPKPHLSIQESMELISRVNRTIRDNLYQSKTLPGPANRCVTETGSYTTTLETPHQGLELIENAINLLGNEAASYLSVALNIAASEIYDPEKGKYETGVGVYKSSDEMIEVFADLIAKFPRIMMLIEPFINHDQIAWYKLYSRLSKYCLVANNFKFNDTEEKAEDTEILQAHSPIETKLPEILRPPNSVIMPVNFYKFQNATNVSHISKIFKENDEKNLMSGLSCGLNENDDNFIVDLSVGNQIKFLKIGGFNRSERVGKINRLIEIESYLMENKRLVDPKNELREIKFSPEIQIPEEIVESLTNIDETKAAKPAKK